MNRLILSSLLASAVVSFPAAAQTSAPADPAGLIAMEDALSASYAKRDRSVIERVVAPDFIGYYNGEKMDRNDYIRVITDGRVTFHSIRNHDVSVDYYGDTAVVQGFNDEVTSENGKRSAGTFQWTDVFVKRIGAWVIVRSQNNKVK